jgi:hypothetical protein
MYYPFQHTVFAYDWLDSIKKVSPWKPAAFFCTLGKLFHESPTMYPMLSQLNAS